ncbi:MAG: hypothetical protein M1608_03550 [Candidatus Omnitrophica bacterium]|nr:hypothetical protein [Candidatus Omnitrophota bacterium]
MFEIFPVDDAHPAGEPKSASAPAAESALEPNRLPIDLHGRRACAEWYPYAPVTPLGQLVYFSQFLATAGLFSEWVTYCPLSYTSPDAPSVTDVLGTATLAILAGNKLSERSARKSKQKQTPISISLARQFL